MIALHASVIGRLSTVTFDKEKRGPKYNDTNTNGYFIVRGAMIDYTLQLRYTRSQFSIFDSKLLTVIGLKLKG
ncbi:MAG: hypothetical protein ACYDD1_20505 [Caulobacteraceae bacterium]